MAFIILHSTKQQDLQCIFQCRNCCFCIEILTVYVFGMRRISKEFCNLHLYTNNHWDPISYSHMTCFLKIKQNCNIVNRANL